MRQTSVRGRALGGAARISISGRCCRVAALPPRHHQSKRVARHLIYFITSPPMHGIIKQVLSLSLLLSMDFSEATVASSISRTAK